MSDIHIFDRDHKLVCDIPVEEMISDGLDLDLQTGSVNYEFSIPAELEEGQLIENEFFVVIPAPDPEYGWIEMKAKELDGDAIQGTRDFKAELSAISDLNADFIRPVTFDHQGPKEILTSILSGSGWEIGEVASAGVATLSFLSYPKKMKGVQSVKDQFGLDIRFRVKYVGNKVIGRYVDLLDQRGSDNGKEFEYARDLQGLKRTESSTELYTGVLPLGQTDSNGQYLTIKSISRTRTGGYDYDKPEGQDYILHQDVSENWGTKIGKFTDTSITDPGDLTDKGWAWLLQQITTKLTFEADPVLLGQMAGYENEKVSLGDTIGIKVTSFVPEILLKARIITVHRSFVDPSQDKVTLGDYHQIAPNTYTQIQQLQNSLDQKEGVINGKTRVIRSDAAPSDTTAAWVDISQTPNIVKTYDGSSWVKATPTVADEIAESATKKWAAESGADVTSNNTAANTQKVNNTDAATVEGNAASGAAAKSKIDSDVGSNTIETTSGSQSKADSAQSAAETYTNDQLTNYVQTVTYTSKVNDLQSQIDKSITTWFSSGVPTLSNYPASNWTTTDDKNTHLGDLYYDNDTGYAYRFRQDSTSAYGWLRITDSDVTKALQEASTAQDTADQKRRVFVSQPVPPYDVGDLWDSSNGIQRCANAKVSGQTFVSTDFQLASDITANNTAANTQKVNNTDAAIVEGNAANGNEAHMGTIVGSDLGVGSVGDNTGSTNLMLSQDFDGDGTYDLLGYISFLHNYAGESNQDPVQAAIGRRPDLATLISDMMNLDELQIFADLFEVNGAIQQNGNQVYHEGMMGTWQALTLAGGVTNHGNGYTNAAVMKDAFGFVHFRGLVEVNVSGPTTICQLPAGYYPSYDVTQITWHNAPCESVRVYFESSTGRLRQIATSDGVAGYVSLDDISPVYVG